MKSRGGCWEQEPHNGSKVRGTTTMQLSVQGDTRGAGPLCIFLLQPISSVLFLSSTARNYGLCRLKPFCLLRCAHLSAVVGGGVDLPTPTWGGQPPPAQASPSPLPPWLLPEIQHDFGILTDCVRCPAASKCCKQVSEWVAHVNLLPLTKCIFTTILGKRGY